MTRRPDSVIWYISILIIKLYRVRSNEEVEVEGVGLQRPPKITESLGDNFIKRSRRMIILLISKKIQFSSFFLYL